MLLQLCTRYTQNPAGTAGWTGNVGNPRLITTIHDRWTFSQYESNAVKPTEGDKWACGDFCGKCLHSAAKVYGRDESELGNIPEQ